MEKYFEKISEAKKWLSEAKYEDEHGNVGHSSFMTLNTWFDYWITEVKNKSVRPNTVKNYKGRYNHNIKSTLGNMIIGEPKSKSGYRTIPMTQIVYDLLIAKKHEVSQRKICSMKYKDFVFINRNGLPTKNSSYDSALYKLTQKANIEKFSMHTLRHTFATRCIEADMKPKALQHISGHANIGITMNLYVHITEAEKEIKKIEQIYKMA